MVLVHLLYEVTVSMNYACLRIEHDVFLNVLIES